MTVPSPQFHAPEPDQDRGRIALEFAAKAWFMPVLIGQFIFVAYILYAYGGPVFAADPTAWNAHLSQAWVPDRAIGNAAVAAHLALAIIVHIGGPLQLVPTVRQKFPGLHRWTGRTFILAVLIAVLSGAYMLLVRDIGAWTLRLGFVLQAILIIWFAGLTLQRARQRRFDQHMQWATRLFLAASAVWFFRVLIMIWFVVTGGIGIDTRDGTGSFIDFMSFGQFLPLLVYELYARLKQKGTATSRYILAVFLWIAAALTSVGVALATVGMWFPILD